MPDTEWLDADQQRIWRALLGGTTVLIDRLDRDLRAGHGLSMPEYEILVRLSESPDRSIRMAELAASVAHSRSRITHTIARLERGGLVQRGQATDDRRGVIAELTDEGFALLEQAAHTHVRGVQDYLVRIVDPDDFRAVGRVMEAVRETLDGRPF
ncbi:MarR family winged helix-turn-helix transcriptional regulator [Aeromicrobium sp. CTD01-1L150]|uniref:MarR family winged helix-turn-helix transcriptional regulator n=1 Tax=Aeromicrobium sp. CTD01-1L150 TaxID=3341830 RepID=UPI0035C1210D